MRLRNVSKNVPVPVSPVPVIARPVGYGLIQLLMAMHMDLTCSVTESSNAKRDGTLYIVHGTMRGDFFENPAQFR